MDNQQDLIMHRRWYIYKIINNINGKTYIGQRHHDTNDPEIDDVDYLGSGKLIWKAYEKYGIHNFTKVIIRKNIESRKLADDLERFYIYISRLANEANYNVSNGGTGGYLVPLSESSREILRIKSKERWNDCDYRERCISYGNTNVRGRIWITNGIDNKMIHPSDQLPDGYYKGKTTHSKSGKSRDRIWITNGIIDAIIAPSKQSIPEGWRRGKSYSNSKGSKWITDGVNGRMVHLTEGESLPEGWRFGQPPKK